MKADVFAANNPLIAPSEINRILTDKTINNLQIIDVRTPSEFAVGCLPGAKNIDLKSPDFLSQIGELDKNGYYLVYCKSGVRSDQAATEIKQAGFNNIIQLKGGITGWTTAGYSLSYNCK
ncbi:rhodanese-like domain-containing protein [Patescibacteria group bacterium]|nr:rhodanese-like domain-containing protein [Patescibacteria group bacterium]MBU1703092.1 rhodanese-like domain-containing protein [Patescibacteria group bacterium]MBU1954268.1 rhodanese-like domain-containing protein [Patescibacteria group bacterium]